MPAEYTDITEATPEQLLKRMDEILDEEKNEKLYAEQAKVEYKPVTPAVDASPAARITRLEKAKTKYFALLEETNDSDERDTIIERLHDIEQKIASLPNPQFANVDDETLPVKYQEAQSSVLDARRALDAFDREHGNLQDAIVNTRERAVLEAQRTELVDALSVSFESEAAIHEEQGLRGVAKEKQRMIAVKAQGYVKEYFTNLDAKELAEAEGKLRSGGMDEASYYSRKALATQPVETRRDYAKVLAQAEAQAAEEWMNH